MAQRNAQCYDCQAKIEYRHGRREVVNEALRRGRVAGERGEALGQRCFKCQNVSPAQAWAECEEVGLEKMRERVKAGDEAFEALQAKRAEQSMAPVVEALRATIARPATVVESAEPAPKSKGAKS